MGKTSEIANNFSDQANKHISKIFYLYAVLMGMKTFSENDIHSSNRSKVTQKIKDELENQADGIGISAQKSEIERVVNKILNAGFSSDDIRISPIERKVIELMKLMGLNFLVYPETIFYMCQIAARRLTALISVEIVMLQAINSCFEDINDYYESLEPKTSTWGTSVSISLYDIKRNNYNILETNQSGQKAIYDRNNYFIGWRYVVEEESQPNLAEFYAKKTTEAQHNIKKIVESVIDGDMNPTATEEFKKIIRDIGNSKNVDKVASYRDPIEMTKKIILRTSYLTQLHERIYEDVEQWKQMLEEYEEVEIVDIFAEATLNYIDDNLEKWRSYFLSIKEKGMFADFRKYLIELNSNKKVVETMFSPESPIGEVEEEGSLTWVDDKDGDDTSPYLENPGSSLEVGDKISIHSQVFDSNNVTISEHEIAGVGLEYIWVDPEIPKPPKNTVYYVKISGGIPLYGKYLAIVNYLNSISIQGTLKLLKYPGEDTRKTWSELLWKMIDISNSENPDVLNTEIKNLTTKKDEVVEKNNQLISKLEDIQYGLRSLALPKNEDMEIMDDIMENSDMDRLRGYFLSGRVKKFFTTSPVNASNVNSMIDKINLLLEEGVLR